jgi:hypothetical protein
METMGICTGCVSPTCQQCGVGPLYSIFNTTGEAVSSVNSTNYGIDWVHKKNGRSHPSEHSVVRQVVEAARRILAKPKSRKVTLTVAQGTSWGVSKGALLEIFKWLQWWSSVFMVSPVG